MSKSLLVVSYVYPPDKSVGGRRWSKMAPYLQRNGNRAFVITATPDEKGEYTEENINGIIVKRVKSPYPGILKYFGAMNLLNKIKYNVLVRYYRYLKKGNIYDTSIGWNENLIPSIIELIKKEQIKNIVVTAPPFRHMYDVAMLKHKYPDLNLILDFRDPWTELKTFGTLNNVHGKQLEFEDRLQRKAVDMANYVVSVSEERTMLFDSSKNDRSKYITVTNGIDMADYDFLAMEPQLVNDMFSIVYNGSLYPETEKSITALIDLINRNKDVLIKAKVKFEFCGHINQQMTKLLRSAPGEIVICHGLLPQQEALRILNRASAGLLITMEGYENIHVNTKLYEYMALKKKIISIGGDDSLSKFLSANKIGVTFSRQKLDELLRWLVNKNEFNSLSYAHFDISPYTITSISAQVEALLK